MSVVMYCMLLMFCYGAYRAGKFLRRITELAWAGNVLWFFGGLWLYVGTMAFFLNN